MSIFNDSCSIKEVSDDNVPLLLLIQNGKSKNAETTKAFDSVNILNFSVSNTCDIQIDRNASGGFTYNSFGKGLHQVVLEGLQTSVSNVGSSGDIESYYNKSCISGQNREKIKITAAYVSPREVKDKSGTKKVNSLAHAEAVTYSGYMVDFIKKPMGAAKVPGYGFTIKLLCVIEPKTT